MIHPSLHDARILALDDKDSNLALLQNICKAGGWEKIRCLQDARRAISTFHEFQPDLILLDLMMPYVSGLEVLEQIKPLVPEGSFLPILVLTADATKEARHKALAAGAHDYLTKPLDRQEVLLRIRNFLETRLLHQELLRHNQSLEAQVQERTSEVRRRVEMIDRARDAIVVLDADDRITFWNRGAEHIYGYLARDVLGRDAGEIFTGWLDPRNSNPQVTLFARGEWQGELTQGAKNGSEVVVQGRHTLVLDDAGRPQGQLLVHSDVTEKRSLMKQLQRVQRMESLGALAGGIAHDLNNMLTPIHLGLAMLKPTIDDPTLSAVLETMEQGAQRGTEMVQQILTFARGTGGQRKEIAVGPLLREIARLAQHTFPRNITVSVEIAPDLSGLVADVTQLHQVLMNLAVNARDAMPQGGRLAIRACNAQRPERDPTSYVLLEVADTGIGIPAEVRGKIFDPFFTTKDLGKGTGLGLATALHIVEGHGGFLEVDSQPGQGTTFRVFLPALDRAAPKNPGAVPAEVPVGQGEWILVVDDEASVREMTRSTLEAAGYRVVTASDGSEALVVFEQYAGKIQAVVLDLMMPVLDGQGTIAVLRRRGIRLPILAVSGSHALLKDSAPLGDVQGFLAKPFRAEEILTAINDLLHPK